MAEVLLRKLSIPLAHTKRIYGRIFGKYLFVTNTVSYVALYAVGDAVTQVVERKAQGKGGSHNFRRTLCIATFAAFQGPVNHFWYLGLDKFIKGARHSTVFKKLLVDQLIFAPYSCVSFYMGLGLLEGQSLKNTVSETKNKFIPTYIADLTIWPAAQILNFYVVPTHLRMMYINGVTLVWNTFMSFMKHKDEVGAVESKQSA